MWACGGLLRGWSYGGGLGWLGGVVIVVNGDVGLGLLLHGCMAKQFSYSANLGRPALDLT